MNRWHNLSREQRQRAIQWGERFLCSFHSMIQTARIHQDNNQMVADCLAQLRQAASQLDTADGLSILVSRGRFYLQGEKLLYRRETFHTIGEMLGFFEQRGLREIRIRANLRKVPDGEMLHFMRLLIRSGEHQPADRWLNERLVEGGLVWAEVRGGADPDMPEELVQERRERAKRAYSSALNSIKEVAHRIPEQGYAGVRRARRAIQNMVDVVMEDESVMLGLATLRQHDDYTYVHSVNVAILSMCLGKRIGLSRSLLEQLGICGVFHDLGKVKVDREILRKSGELNEREWDEMKRHPISSVNQILRLRVSQDVRSRILLAPFEHHLKYDLSGYPRVRVKREVSLFGRILTIADVFDALTSQRAYRPMAYGPDYALSLMLDRAGTEFDPILLKAFINMMGIYPVGTVLQLDTGELGLVVESSKGPDQARPRVLLLVREIGEAFAGSEAPAELVGAVLRDAGAAG